MSKSIVKRAADLMDKEYTAYLDAQDAKKSADHDDDGLVDERHMVHAIPAKLYRQMMEKLTELEKPANIRVEALRAAAMVVAGTVDPLVQPQSNSKPISVQELVLAHAEQFAAWLEG